MANETSTMDLPPHVLEYLHGQKTLTLATASPGSGAPRGDARLRRRRLVAVRLDPAGDHDRAAHRPEPRRLVRDRRVQPPTGGRRRASRAPATARCCSTRPRSTGLSPPFEQKFPSLAGLALDRARVLPDHADRAPVHRQQRPAAGDEGPGIAYHRDLVYSIFHDLPQQEVETVEAQLRTLEVRRGRRDRAPGRARGQVLHRRRRRGRGRPGVGGQDAPARDARRAGSSSARSRSSATRLASPPSARSSPTTLFAMERDVFRSLVAQSMGTTGDFDRVIRQRLEERGHTIVG